MSLEYRTIGCHRSAISAIHDCVDEKPVAQQPEARVNGIFNNRPPQPRYVFMECVIVINYIKTKWKIIKKLSVKYVTYKLVILMALISLSRASAMNCLDVRFIVNSEGAYIFNFHKLHKSRRKGKTPPKLYFYNYSKDQHLCVASALNEYLKRKKTSKMNRDKFQLLLSHIKPHMEFHSSKVEQMDKINRWIKEIQKDIE